MKKILGVALALTMGVTSTAALAGCDSCGGGDDAENVASAIKIIRSTYLSKFNNTESAGDYEVMGKAIVNGTAVDVSWTVTSSVSNLSDYVTVGTSLNSDNEYTVTVNANEVIDYTLTATVKIGKAEEHIDFNRKTVKFMTCAEAKTAATALEADKYSDTQVYVKGYVIDAGEWSTSFKNYQKVYIADTADATTDNAFYVYRIGSDGRNIKANGDLSVGDLVGVHGYLNNYKGNTPQMSYKGSGDNMVNPMCVSMKKAVKTDEQKVAEAKAILDLTQKSFTKKGSIDIDSTVGGAEITWESSNTDIATIANNKLNIVSVPANKTTVTITATIKYGTAQDTKAFEITVVDASQLADNDGTLEHPYTATEAKNVGSALAADGWTATEVYVKGYVVDAGSWSSQYGNYSSVYIGDAADTAKTDAFLVFRIDQDEKFVTGDGSLQVGQLITVKGFITNYKGNTPEIAFKNGSNGVVVAIDGFVEKTPQEKVDAAIAALNVPATVSGKLSFADSNGVSFAITNSTNTAAIALDGTVTRGEADVEVTITVTASIDGATATKDFTVTVKKAVANAGEPASLAFSTLTSTKFEADQAIFESEGMTVTLDKGTSTTAVNNNNYLTESGNGAQLRAYNGSKLTVSFTGISVLVFHVDSYKAEYVTILEASIKATYATGVTVSISGTDVTIEFETAVNEVSFGMTGQSRLKGVDINPAN